MSGNRNWSTTLHGIDADYLVTREWRIAEGRAFEADELRFGGKVVLLGPTVARELFGGENPLGRTVRIGRTSMTVVGVLEPKGGAMAGDDQNDVVLVPLAAARTRLVGRGRTPAGGVDFILVAVADAALLSTAKQQTLALLNQRHRLSATDGDAFRVLEMTDFLQTRARAAGMLQAVLVIVASVSLLVGGIGIMNIMLMSVVERTREMACVAR